MNAKMERLVFSCNFNFFMLDKTSIHIIVGKVLGRRGWG